MVRRHMKNKIAIFILVLFVFTTFGLMAQAKKAKRPDIYDPGLDVKQAIEKSLVQAKKENKHVLLMFGGNWCPWCHKLHDLFKKDEAINKILSERYITILVDVASNADLVPMSSTDLRGLFSDYKKMRGEFPHDDI